MPISVYNNVKSFLHFRRFLRRNRATSGIYEIVNSLNVHTKTIFFLAQLSGRVQIREFSLTKNFLALI